VTKLNGFRVWTLAGIGSYRQAHLSKLFLPNTQMLLAFLNRDIPENRFGMTDVLQTLAVIALNDILQKDTIFPITGIIPKKTVRAQRIVCLFFVTIFNC
jgi:hypothetical protein